MADAYPFGNVTNINSLMVPDAGLAAFPVSFGEDAVGNLYVVYGASNEIYRIATNELLKGDFDADGDVGSADYAKFRAGFGAASENSAADGNSNAVVDAPDYVAWRKNLGASVHARAGAGTGAPVPEPITPVVILQLAVTVVLSAGRMRRHSGGAVSCPRRCYEFSCCASFTAVP
jgi:hypothetical protein